MAELFNLDEVIVFNAQPYAMKAEDGRDMRGVTVKYILSDRLTPCENEQYKGYKLAKVSMDPSVYDKLTVVPGVYKVEMKVKIASDGKATVAPELVGFVSELTPDRLVDVVKAVASADANKDKAAK